MCICRRRRAKATASSASAPLAAADANAAAGSAAASPPFTVLNVQGATQTRPAGLWGGLVKHWDKLKALCEHSCTLLYRLRAWQILSIYSHTALTQPGEKGSSLTNWTKFFWFHLMSLCRWQEGPKSLYHG